ncbi:MAG: hypothetical protein AVDCRST_MAG88-168, partial [uncultured Thermomicrobiales bacterium]
VWQGGDDSDLVTFEYKSALRTDARVSLSPAAAALPEVAQLDELYRPLPPEEMAPPSVPLAELPLLVTFGWYLMVLEAQDAAAATVAAT